MILRVVNGLMAVLFFYSVSLQVNDPDPIRWMAIYGAAGLASAFAALAPARLPWPVPALIGTVALVWSATIAPRVVGKMRFAELFGDWKMKTAVVEEGREAAGLLIVGLWMAVLVARRLVARA